MNFRDLKAAINAAQLHDLADTDAVTVAVDGGGLAIEFDDSELQGRIMELEDDVTRYQEAEKELETKIEELTKERDELAVIVAQVKADGAAQTLADFAGQLSDAQSHARDYRQAMDAAQAECRALRKRKGVDAGLVAHRRAVMDLLCYLAQSSPDSFARYRDDAKSLLAKINAA